MREKTACFTGHRKIPQESIPERSWRSKNTVFRLIEEGYVYFGAGGALGFDTLAAQCVLSLKKQYSHIKLILVLPCITQTKSWGKDDIATYEEIKSHASLPYDLLSAPTLQCMDGTEKRNIPYCFDLNL